MESKVNAYDIFRACSPELRASYKKSYENLLAIENGKVLKTKDGRVIKTDKCPWMKPNWEKGLQIVKEVMMEKEEIEE